MVHTFEKIRTRSPANPNEAAPATAMPQAAGEALLRDVLQGLRPGYTPETLCLWLETSQPQEVAIGAPQAQPPPHHNHTGKGKGKKKARGKEARRGPMEQAGAHCNRAPWGNTTWGQETMKRPGKGKARRHGTRGEGATTGTRAHTQEGQATRTDQHRPVPSRHRRTPGGARPPRRAAATRTGRRRNRTGLRPISQPDPAQGQVGSPTRGEELLSPGEPLRTPRSPPPHPNRQARTGHSKGHHTGMGTGTRGGRGQGRGTQDGGVQESRGTGPEGTQRT